MAKRAELIGIQILRGYCATAVVIAHAAGMIGLEKYGGQVLLGGVLSRGSFGVDVFFVLSGFIISVTTLRGEDRHATMTRATFMEKRFTRIVPMMWLAIVAYAAMQAIFLRGGTFDYAAYTRAIFLFPSGHLRPDVIWTLRQEFIFYILFCISFLGPRYLRPLMVLWAAAPFGYVAYLGSWTATTGFIDSFFALLFSACNIELSSGLMLGLLWVKRRPADNLELPLHPVLVIGCAMLTIPVLQGVFDLSGQTIPAVAIAAVIGTGLVALAARAKCRPDALTRLGEILGNASYSIYLFHSHVLVVLLTLRVKLHLAVPATLLFLIAVAAALLVGVAINLLVEKRLIVATRALFGRRVLRPSTP